MSDCSAAQHKISSTMRVDRIFTSFADAGFTNFSDRQMRNFRVACVLRGCIAD